MISLKKGEHGDIILPQGALFTNLLICMVYQLKQSRTIGVPHQRFVCLFNKKVPQIVFTCWSYFNELLKDTGHYW